MTERTTARIEWERVQHEQDELCVMLGRGCQRWDIKRRVAEMIDLLDSISEALPEGYREDREHNLLECVQAMSERIAALKEPQ